MDRPFILSATVPNPHKAHDPKFGSLQIPTGLSQKSNVGTTHMKISLSPSSTTNGLNSNLKFLRGTMETKYESFPQCPLTFLCGWMLTICIAVPGPGVMTTVRYIYVSRITLNARPWINPPVHQESAPIL